MSALEPEQIRYVLPDETLNASVFLSLANKVWPGDYRVESVVQALAKTINFTAWDGQRLIGCARLLTDGYFFGTIPEILVHPAYQGRGIGKRLMESVWELSPTSLFFGAQPGNEPFFEKLGYTKSIQSYHQKKKRRGSTSPTDL